MSDNMELIRLLGTRFIQRKDVKSFQNAKGEWHPDRSPMTLADFTAHLDGSKTMGHYLVSPEDQTCKFFAFDLDARKPDPKVDYTPVTGTGDPYNPREAWLDVNHVMHDEIVTQVRCLAEGLARRVHETLDLPIAIVNSGGKGFHVYCFTGQIPAEAAVQMAHSLLETFTIFEPVRGKNFWRHTDPTIYQEVEIETFPKQTQVSEDGMGNLMKLPLGINRKTNQRSHFVSTRSSLTDILEMDPIRALEGDLPWE